MKKTILASFTLLSLTLFGQVTPGSFSIVMDQDFLYRTPFAKNEDRNYTQGTAFIYSHPKLIKSPLFYPISKLGKFYDTPHGITSSFGVGGTAFTPRIIDSINPIVGDRPFAFLFYVSTSSTFQNTKKTTRPSWIVKHTKWDETKTKISYHTYTINYGVFGTSLGYEFQSFAHTHLVQGRPKDPQGWNTQISQGGAPTLLLDYNRNTEFLRLKQGLLFHKKDSTEIAQLSSTKKAKYLRKEQRSKSCNFFDASWTIGGSAGYYDRFYTGFFGRVGNLHRGRNFLWSNKAGVMDGSSKELNKFTKTQIKKKWYNFWLNSELFLFGRVNSTLMFRNDMLVGQRFFHSDYVLDQKWTKTYLVEYEWGIGTAIYWKRQHEDQSRSVQILWKQTRRSPEFDSKLFPKRWHYFGSISITIPVR